MADYWTNAHGTLVDIDDMSDLYVFNTLKYVFKTRELNYEYMPEDAITARQYLRNFVRRQKKETDAKRIRRTFGVNPMAFSMYGGGV